jgi:hypothetical protein
MYNMKDESLNQEQFDTLNQERAEFVKLLTIGYTRNITAGWLAKMRSIHNALFGGNVNVNCNKCIIDAMRRLWRKMEAFEAVQAAKQAPQPIPEPIQPVIEQSGPTDLPENTPVDKPVIAPQTIKESLNETQSITGREPAIDKPFTTTSKTIHSTGNSRSRHTAFVRRNPNKL